MKRSRCSSCYSEKISSVVYFFDSDVQDEVEDVVECLETNEVSEGSEEVGDNEDEGDDGGQNNIVQCEDDMDSVLENRFGSYMVNENEESDDNGDELWRDDNIPSLMTSDDEDDEEIGRHDHEVTEPGDDILALGKSFGSCSEFKQALLRYSLKTRYDIKLYISTQKKLGAVCSDVEFACPWRVYCSYEKSIHNMQIKVFENKHICIRTRYTKLLKVSTIAQLFEERLRLNPRITAVEMANEIKKAYNLNVMSDQCRKAKSKLSREIRKTPAEHFGRIWDYKAEIHKTNQGTIVDIETIPGTNPRCLQRFDRIYLCFESQRVSWKTYCRPIIGLDGAFLKWDVKGQLLAAIGRDGDNRIVPIAWAVVEIENDYNWDWFVNHLKRDLGLGEGVGFTFISDKQKELVKAVHNQLPQAEHRMCARHILANWKRENHDIQLERLFWKIARSYTEGDYNANMTIMRQCDQGAYESLLKTNPPQWSRAFFKVGSFCNDNLNNLCESFNKTIREVRKNSC